MIAAGSVTEEAIHRTKGNNELNGSVRYDYSRFVDKNFRGASWLDVADGRDTENVMESALNSFHFEDDLRKILAIDNFVNLYLNDVRIALDRAGIKSEKVSVRGDNLSFDIVGIPSFDINDKNHPKAGMFLASVKGKTDLIPLNEGIWNYDDFRLTNDDFPPKRVPNYLSEILKGYTLDEIEEIKKIFAENMDAARLDVKCAIVLLGEYGPEEDVLVGNSFFKLKIKSEDYVRMLKGEISSDDAYRSAAKEEALVLQAEMIHGYKSIEREIERGSTGLEFGIEQLINHDALLERYKKLYELLDNENNYSLRDAGGMAERYGDVRYAELVEEGRRQLPDIARSKMSEEERALSNVVYSQKATMITNKICYGLEPYLGGDPMFKSNNVDVNLTKSGVSGFQINISIRNEKISIPISRETYTTLSDRRDIDSYSYRMALKEDIMNAFYESIERVNSIGQPTGRGETDYISEMEKYIQESSNRNVLSRLWNNLFDGEVGCSFQEAVASAMYLGARTSFLDWEKEAKFFNEEYTLLSEGLATRNIIYTPDESRIRDRAAVNENLEATELQMAIHAHGRLDLVEREYSKLLEESESPEFTKHSRIEKVEEEIKELKAQIAGFGQKTEGEIKLAPINTNEDTINPINSFNDNLGELLSDVNKYSLQDSEPMTQLNYYVKYLDELIDRDEKLDQFYKGRDPSTITDAETAHRSAVKALIVTLETNIDNWQKLALEHMNGVSTDSRTAINVGGGRT